MFAAAADTIRPRAKTWEEYYDASAFFVSPPLLRPPYDPSEDMLDNAVSTPSTPPQQPTKDDPGSPLSNGPMASLLVVRSTSHEFNISSCYILEESKKLVLRDAEKLLLLHQQLSTASLNSMCSIGMSSAWLRIRHNMANGRVYESSLSGFRLGSRTIISCAHFLKWEQVEDEEVRRQVVEALWKGEAGSTFGQGRDRDSASFEGKILLKGLRIKDDIALWDLSEVKGADEHFLSFEDIDANATLGGRFSFSVGYNTEPPENAYKAQWKGVWNDLSEEQKAIAGHAEFSQIKPPATKDYLRVESRTISLGGTIDPNEFGGFGVYIDCSGCQGRSGGMVGVADQRGQVKIVGIFWGGFATNTRNEMVLLDDERKKWIYDVMIEPRQQPNLALLFP